MAGEVQPVAFLTVGLRPDASSSLFPGQQGSALVQRGEAGLFLRVAGQVLPLPADAPFVPGQPVLWRFEAGESGLRFLIRARPPGPAEAAQTGGAAAQLLARSLGALGLAFPLEQVSRMLPPGIAADSVRVLPILRLLFGSGAGETRWLMETLHRAAQGGVLSRADAAILGAVAQLLAAQDAEGFRRLLERLGSERRIEARLAAMLETGHTEGLEALREEWGQTLARLRGDETLREWLRAQGLLKRFEDAVGSVLERQRGAQLQELHALQRPYCFFDLPPAGETGCERAQLHVLPDPRGAAAGEHAVHQVVLDLETRHLGRCWVQTVLHRGGCSCTFQVERAMARDAVAAAAGELEQGLRDAGLAHAAVHVCGWNGDRAAMLARLLGADAAGLDVQT